MCRACVVEPFRITDGSMEPQFREGDIFLVSKFSYGLRIPGSGSLLWQWSRPKKGDKVVIIGYGDPPVDYLRTVVKLPNDEIFYEEQGATYVLKEDEYGVAAERVDSQGSEQQILLVKLKSIIGKAKIFWPYKKSSDLGTEEIESTNKKRFFQWVE
ncbi:MAG: S26 family signal peptidase [Oligoflexia bacterium]|nr:S26 family signal peptidase [Oligoflexia bacterium]